MLETAGVAVSITIFESMSHFLCCSVGNKCSVVGASCVSFNCARSHLGAAGATLRCDKQTRCVNKEEGIYGGASLITSCRI